MQGAKIATLGGVASVAALWGSTISAGLLSAVLFILALAVVPVALGAAIGTAAAARANNPTKSPFQFRFTQSRGGCGCGRPRLELAGILICAECDAVG